VPGLAAAAEKLTLAQRVLPPGNAAEAIASAETLGLPVALLWLAALAGYGVALVWILDFRLRAQYLGENLSEADVRRTSSGERRKLIGWKVPRIPGPIAAVFEKELRTLSRSGPMLLTLIMPILALFLLRIGRWHSGGARTAMLGAADYGFPVGCVYALLMLTNLVYNSFGADGSGMQFFLFSPIRFREIVLGKNLAHVSCLLGEVVLVGLVVNFVYGPPAPAMIAATIAGLLFAAPMTFAAGNLLSIYSPKKVDYGTFGRQRASQVTVLASFGIQIVIFGMGALTVFISYLYGNLWLATPVFLVLAAVTSATYFITLGRLDRMAFDRRETLVAELGKA
jgi:ABC-2 type transport system permease protein